MGKAKTSRKERRLQRIKSERARQHGLPAREPERPSQPVRGDRRSWSARARPASNESEAEDETAPSEETKKDPTQRALALLKQVRELPAAAKLAIVSVIAIVLLAVFARRRDQTAADAVSSELKEVAPRASASAPVSAIPRELPLPGASAASTPSLRGSSAPLTASLPPSASASVLSKGNLPGITSALGSARQPAILGGQKLTPSLPRTAPVAPRPQAMPRPQPASPGERPVQRPVPAPPPDNPY